MKEELALYTPNFSLKQPDTIQEINNLDSNLSQHFHSKFLSQSVLTRQHVSFQANKTRPAYRWYKFKEAFSASLVEYLLSKYHISGKILDPFAGSGTALFAASQSGLDADGIELLPFCHRIISAKRYLGNGLTSKDIAILKRWSDEKPWAKSAKTIPLNKIKITDGAYSPNTLNAIEQYLASISKEEPKIQIILQFALLCVLESISYTRKDGQCLRWDIRSGRQLGGKAFNKGNIPTFTQATSSKINEIINDIYERNLSLSFDKKPLQGNINHFKGSCLNVLPELPKNTYNAIITSPPYCNRYDYTRTYALELAMLGTTEDEIRDLRQQMLSCTVENRAKDLLHINPKWAQAMEITDRQELLQSILKYLDDQKNMGVLNNSGIPRMIRGYFYEMACVISECLRVLKPNGLMFMVNDNVRYAGVSISVDTILSKIAEELGFRIENILVLPNGKGNSSQQMGKHGRVSLRKCIYVWRKA
ncbi:MAG: site-specific DNA-methyltransferase [Planctomycetes bacterium]|nr:site-specific DNA-methyltransferase [Planctomycetota bacterium]